MLELLSYEYGALSVAHASFAWAKAPLSTPTGSINGQCARVQLGAYLGDEPKKYKLHIGYIEENPDDLLSEYGSAGPVVAMGHQFNSVENFQFSGQLRSINPDGSPMLANRDNRVNVCTGTRGRDHLIIGDEDWLHVGPYVKMSQYEPRWKVAHYWVYVSRLVHTQWGEAVALVCLASSYIEHCLSPERAYYTRPALNCYIWAYHDLQVAHYTQDAKPIYNDPRWYFSTAEDPNSVLARLSAIVDDWKVAPRFFHNRLTWYEARLKLARPESIPAKPYYWLNWDHGGYVPAETITNYNADSIFPPAKRNPNWRDMAREAYDDLGFWDGNGIALVKDLFEMRETVNKTLSVIKSLGKGKLTAIAGVFLAFHYGWKLLAKDVGELADALDNYQETFRCRAHESWTVALPDRSFEAFASYGVDCEAFGKVSNDLRKLQMMLDLDLTADNLWDLIPYSFVVDWFVGIGDVLTELNGFFQLRQNHKILACWRSIRCTAPSSPEKLGLYGWFGQVEAKYYKRQYLARPIEPSLLPDVTVVPAVQHWIEGAALVVARY